MSYKRIAIFDVFRGLATMVVVIFHATIYNYANTETFDFSNSSPLVVLISFMALWGGVFIIFSMVVNVIMLLHRLEEGDKPKFFIHLFISGIFYLAVHYLIIIFLGRWSNDFASQHPNLTMVAGSLRNKTLTFPSPSKFFESSSLSTIALNMMVMSLVLFMLFRKGGIAKVSRNLLILGVLGTLILLFSFFRIYLYPYFVQAKVNMNGLSAILLGFSLAHPYPLVAYCSHFFFGAMTGILIYHHNSFRIYKIILPIGLFFLLLGLIGMSKFEFTVSQPDYFWYFKTNFELGIFLMILMILVSVRWSPIWLQKLSLLRWFSRVSLSVFLLETTVSELMRIIWYTVSSQWVESVLACVLFGLFNLLVWIGIIITWKKISFKYSFEYFWVKCFHWLGKDSTKLDWLGN